MTMESLLKVSSVHWLVWLVPLQQFALYAKQDTSSIQTNNVSQVVRWGLSSMWLLWSAWVVLTTATPARMQTNVSPVMRQMTSEYLTQLQKGAPQLTDTIRAISLFLHLVLFAAPLAFLWLCVLPVMAAASWISTLAASLLVPNIFTKIRKLLSALPVLSTVWLVMQTRTALPAALQPLGLLYPTDAYPLLAISVVVLSK